MALSPFAFYSVSAATLHSLTGPALSRLADDDGSIWFLHARARSYCVRLLQVCKLFGDYISRRHDDHSLRRVLVAICQAAKLACKNADTFASREFSAYGELLKQIAGFVFGESKLGVRATTSKALLLAYARSSPWSMLSVHVDFVGNEISFCTRSAPPHQLDIDK